MLFCLMGKKLLKMVLNMTGGRDQRHAAWAAGAIFLFISMIFNRKCRIFPLLGRSCQQTSEQMTQAIRSWDLYRNETNHPKDNILSPEDVKAWSAVSFTSTPDF